MQGFTYVPRVNPIFSHTRTKTTDFHECEAVVAEKMAFGFLGGKEERGKKEKKSHTGSEKMGKGEEEMA
jgi:hypothetical protein